MAKKAQIATPTHTVMLHTIIVISTLDKLDGVRGAGVAGLMVVVVVVVVVYTGTGGWSGPVVVLKGDGVAVVVVLG